MQGKSARAGRLRAGAGRGMDQAPHVRSALWTLAAMAASVLGIAVFVGATGSLQPDDTVLGGSLTGATFGLLVGASVGVLVISREYASRHHRRHPDGLPAPRAWCWPPRRR